MMADFDFKKEVPAAFPVLDDKQLAVVAEFAECKTYHDGEVLFRAGETDFKFNVVRRGAIEIYDRSSGDPRRILTHEAGEFTGDLANLTGRSSNVDAIATGETEVYEVGEPDLRRIIGERPDLSDLLLHTFIVRAQTLGENEGFTGLRVIGERFSPNTFRLRDFLSKNQVNYTFFDVETEAAKTSALVTAFDLQKQDLPVVGYGCDLGKNMSDYLVQRITQTENIELLTTTEITEMFGDTHLEAVEIKNHQTNETKKISVAGVFSFIGAIPCTGWLKDAIELDDNGFIKTGLHINLENWTNTRPPFYLETSCAGIFAAGDVRCNSVKRVASSVGEGSMAVTFAHQYLAEKA